MVELTVSGEMILSMPTSFLFLNSFIKSIVFITQNALRHSKDLAGSALLAAVMSHHWRCLFVVGFLSRYAFRIAYQG